MDDNGDITSRDSDRTYVQCLEKVGAKIHGKTVLDVGCATGSFMKYAREELQATEAWGVDYNQDALQEGLEDGVIEESDQQRYLVMAFSEIPDKRPEFKGKFDIIKITAVTPYADVKEMRLMSGVAHWLLKKDGCVLIELPWMDQMGRSFQAHQNGASVLGGIAAQTEMMLKSLEKGDRRHLAKMGDKIRKFKDAYRKLIELHFGKITEVRPDGIGTEIILAQAPREKIPEVRDLSVNPATMEVKLGPSAVSLVREIEQEKPKEKLASDAQPENLLGKLLLRKSGPSGSGVFLGNPASFR